ncbi:putative cellobiose dehydrogenase [Phaeomoniella chlamydospora]|uniref:Putative cellobiose dehydrogenase n=1 Tax=Phaeomoniella chlamydospora TaxID=158046 RepID=A0A0G2G7R0_PHACM|nr:putative cellobiose dehydrogenase [Phaeomoniella chlamydospora]
MACVSGISKILLVFVLLIHPWSVWANPVQFCKSASDYNFCFALESYKNATTGELDAYMTFQTTRETSSALGWVGVGFGNVMEGSLMFIMYGDPKSKTGPTLSIRTTPGHNQPTVLEAETIPQLHVADTSYANTKDSPQNILTAHIICYSCEKRLGRPEGQPFQSFIWAVNPTQDFDNNFADNVDLKMHSHESGFGNFYAEMSKSIAADKSIASVPAITNTKSNTATQETPPPGTPAALKASTRTFRSQMWAVHGILMTISFYFLYPLGIIVMRGGLPRAVRLHWVIQAIATITATTGSLIGIMLSRRFIRWHQYIGCFVLFAVLMQSLLGWRHHITYLRTKQKTWMSKIHVWLGHIILLLGWLELIMGMVLKHWSYLSIMATISFIMIESGAVFFSPVLVSYAQNYRSLDTFTNLKSGRRNTNPPNDEEEEYFALEDRDHDRDYAIGSEEDDDDDDQVYSQEAHGAMPATGLMSGIPAKGLEDDGGKDQRTWLPK